MPDFALTIGCLRTGNINSLTAHSETQEFLPVELLPASERTLATATPEGSLYINGQLVENYYANNLVSLPEQLSAKDTLHVVPTASIEVFVLAENSLSELNITVQGIAVPAYICAKLIQENLTVDIELSTNRLDYSKFLYIESLPKNIWVKVPTPETSIYNVALAAITLN